MTTGAQTVKFFAKSEFFDYKVWGPGALGPRDPGAQGPWGTGALGPGTLGPWALGDKGLVPKGWFRGASGTALY